MTLREAIAAATSQLEGRDAARDATLLVLHTLSLARTAPYTDAGRHLGAEEQLACNRAIARRAAGEPIQYITGQQEFYGLLLKVSPAVLIPRPETELLVEAVLERISGSRPVQILDVGTGSGAIAIALAHKLPMARVLAVDLSEAALAVAEENAAAHGLTDRVRLLKSDLLEAVVADGFDAVVSNPPYVPETDRESLDRQVREYEPTLALFAGDDGLTIYRRLIPQAIATLKQGGFLAMEIGYGRSGAVARLLEAWEGVEFLDDLQGIPRVAVAFKPANIGEDL